MMKKLKKDREKLLAFYNFPSEHLASIITMKQLNRFF
ncbi:MAG: hypothetical protein ACTS73_07595 [Arsenophonus sp. NEOnobi-MAG3]